MKISVIIPCYNAARYLDACLTSVLSQDETNFEVLLIDDGSRDDTRAIAERFARQDARVHVFFQENAGVSAARNRGLDAARGKWVTFVDADDLLAPGALRTMLAAAECDGDVDLVVCAHETFETAAGREVCRIVRPETRWMDARGERRRRAAALRLIEGDSVLNIMCGKLHRRAMLEREGLRLLPGLTVAEDALFNLEAVLCCREIAYVAAPVYRYRMHAQSAMHTQTRGAFDVHAPWFCAMRAMLARRGALERYFPALLDSVALRLYKDGGVPGVVLHFNRCALPVLDVDALDVRQLRLRGRALRALCRTGAYPAVYPLLFPGQVARRKWAALCCALRRE